MTGFVSPTLASPGFRSVGFRDIGSPAGAPQTVPIAVYRFYEGRNLLKYSQDFDNAVWSKIRSSIVPNAALAPNGTMTADKIVEDGTAGNLHYINQNNATTYIPGTTYTFSIFGKKAERTWFMVWPTGTLAQCAVWFDLNAGVVGTKSGSYVSSATIRIDQNGYFRCIVAVTVGAGETYGPLGGGAPADGTYSWNGDGASGINVWGAQLEVGSTPTDYFPTTDKQLLIDYSGNGNHGTLGSTTGVDTNDPAWTNLGLSYGADDYVKFGPIRNAAGVTQNLGSMSMAFYVPGAISAASTKTCSYSIGAGKAVYFGAVSGAPANNIVTVQYAAGSYSSWCHATDTIPIGWHTLEVNWNGSSYDIYIDGIPKPVTPAGSPTVLSLTDANCCYDGTTFGTSGLIRAGRRIYPTGLSYSDLMQARRLIASDAAQKGIVLP